MARAADRSAKGSRGVRGRSHDLAAAHRAWAVAEPHRDLLVQGAPVPGHVAPADTWERARVVLGPFLPLFATGSPGPAVASTADGMTAWLAADSTVGSWLSRYAPEAAGAPDGEVRAASAVAGAVPACTQSYGSVSLEAGRPVRRGGTSGPHAAGRAHGDAGGRVRTGVREGRAP
ncbi:hypothetical protein ACFQ6C_04725 [Streptomyces sp. NPDC056454]|uniref:hypothetical protein n=1 Tax=Streptomyces sp. NPDC056454 TaxID=3345823 RepID=UPI00367474E7